MALPRHERLRERGKFTLLFKKGKSLADRNLVLYYYPAEPGTREAGFSVGKKLGKAVIRNRIRRRMKEAYRRLLPGVTPGYLLLFIGRRPILQADFKEILDSEKKLLKKANLWKGDGKK